MMYNKAMILESVRRTPRTLGATLKKLSKDSNFENIRPNTHKIISSLASSYDVRGKLTDNQKVLANKLIEQQVQYLVDAANARVSQFVTTPIVEDDEPEREPGDESEVEFDEDFSLDCEAGCVEYHIAGCPNATPIEND